MLMIEWKLIVGCSYCLDTLLSCEHKRMYVASKPVFGTANHAKRSRGGLDGDFQAVCLAQILQLNDDAFTSCVGSLEFPETATRELKRRRAGVQTAGQGALSLLFMHTYCSIA